MPSVASEVNASLSLPPSQRPRTQPAASESALQPFASLLDATAPPAPEAPPEPDAQDLPQRAEPAAPTTSPRADNAPGNTVVKSPPAATGSPKPSKDDARVANKKDDKAAGQTAKSDTNVKAEDVPATFNADDGKDKAADDSADKNAATSATVQAQAPIAPQPVAVAVVAIGMATTAGASASDADKTGAIDADKNAKPVVISPTSAPAADAKDAPLGDTETSAADPAATDGKAAIPTPIGKPATDTKAKPAEVSGKPADGAGDKASKAAPTGTAKAVEPTDSGRSEMHHEAAPAPDGQDASAGATGDQHQAAAKPDADALPSFGFSATNTTAAPLTTAASAPTVTVPVAGLAVEIASRAQGGSNRFDIRLDPPELGRIDVRLDVDRDGQVATHVTVDRPETLTLLQHDQPHLERALEQAGLKTADNGLQFTLRDQSFNGQQSGQDNGGSGQNVARLVIPDADLGTVETITSRYRSFGIGGGVDISV